MKKTDIGKKPWASVYCLAIFSFSLHLHYKLLYAHVDKIIFTKLITGYIVEIATGDATFGSDIYYSIYAVGFTLFIFTLIMNLISYWISKRYREEY